MAMQAEEFRNDLADSKEILHWDSFVASDVLPYLEGDSSMISKRLTQLFSLYVDEMTSFLVRLDRNSTPRLPALGFSTGNVNAMSAAS